VARSLKELPERFSSEENLGGKPGNYRSVTQWHYKIVYKVLENEVLILRFLHTARHTKAIRKLE
jgi:plasmid stabilization system protein ParE